MPRNLAEIFYLGMTYTTDRIFKKSIKTQGIKHY